MEIKEIILYCIVGLFLAKLIKEMKKQNFHFLTELASIAIAFFKASFSLLNDIVK